MSMKANLKIGPEGFEPKYGVFRNGVEMFRHPKADGAVSYALRQGWGKISNDELFLDFEVVIAWLGGGPDPSGKYVNIPKRE